MPTILRIGPYRFFFYSSDAGEPIHVHVERDEKVAKFWLAPVSTARDGGFSNREPHEIKQLIGDNEVVLTEAWNEYFGT